MGTQAIDVSVPLPRTSDTLIAPSAAPAVGFKLPQLPLRAAGLEYAPAIPIDVAGMLDTLAKLDIRLKQREQALEGLARTFTIDGSTARAHDFLFGGHTTDAQQAGIREKLRVLLNRNPLGVLADLLERIKAQDAEPVHYASGGAKDLTTLSLDDPRQGSISWTTFPDVYSLGQPHLDEWAATLDVTQPDKATEAFFPTFARYGRNYNLVLPKKVQARNVDAWRDLFAAAWTPALDASANAGLLYVIDLRIYEPLKPQKVAGMDRFTPSTVTVLVQDAKTKAMTPELIRVAGGSNEPKIFSRRGSTTPAAWMYALQAAKVSVTVYGVWLGHVYQWHLVTAAMLMTMFETFSPRHPVRKLLEPQSNYLIPFDGVLLLGWTAVDAAPPTSITTAWKFLELVNLYGKGRQFFDDDPNTALEQLGFTESDFTVNEPWDQYPMMGELLEIWNATGRYVNTYVDRTYSTDADVQRDQQLKAWIAESSSRDGGNIGGLPAMNSKEALKRVLQSVLYRILAHGGSRLFRGANPALTFVANYPPCLQDAKIPDPTASFETRELLRYLPNTGSIGSMMLFYFTFWASPPYVPFVPIAGIETDLFFDDAASNQALIELRRFIAGFIEKVQPDVPQVWQWERHIEL